ncbi:uncharacterized protein BO97DRAFT_413658 [Aspergillus homomorphus CBS 101889]|uniref:Uncharacterized protein n=1 Tax=Aspergillus homomorphus (strain CBS 101889) TaxID=1450537 RepID=A0A395I203_ASPHC|nr:hypothetical protein BO97DRAFT_413658 [Aspergillus homomorphus CBS 101889]RAL13208.1 hypothetical protein BO97DRAFT_413658 [Aspergillus homomorphus CBS 101889]
MVSPTFEPRLSAKPSNKILEPTRHGTGYELADLPGTAWWEQYSPIVAAVTTSTPPESNGLTDPTGLIYNEFSHLQYLDIRYTWLFKTTKFIHNDLNVETMRASFLRAALPQRRAAFRHVTPGLTFQPATEVTAQPSASRRKQPLGGGVLREAPGGLVHIPVPGGSV